MDKVLVIHKYKAEEVIVIGDSVTDVDMASQAHVVFARKHLGEYLRKMGRSFISWEDFCNVRDALARRWFGDDQNGGSTSSRSGTT